MKSLLVSSTFVHRNSLFFQINTTTLRIGVNNTRIVKAMKPVRRGED